MEKRGVRAQHLGDAPKDKARDRAENALCLSCARQQRRSPVWAPADRGRV